MVQRKYLDIINVILLRVYRFWSILRSESPYTNPGTLRLIRAPKCGSIKSYQVGYVGTVVQSKHLLH